MIELKHSTRRFKGRRILGGEDADEAKYPYVVRLQYRVTDESVLPEVHYLAECTGAVLTATWTLTAAHCLRETTVTDGNGKLYPVTPVIISGPFDNLTISQILYIISHPAYIVKPEENDIALIRNEPIILKEYARVSALDYVTMIGLEVILTGYGVTHSFVGPEIFVDDATTLKMPLQILLGLIVKNDEKNGLMSVARECDMLATACPGDSGGPVIHSSGVVGLMNSVLVAGHNLCTLKSFSLFHTTAFAIPTSPHIDWISNTIQNEVSTHP